MRSRLEKWYGWSTVGLILIILAVCEIPRSYCRNKRRSESLRKQAENSNKVVEK